MWTSSDTTIWFQTISSTLLGTKMLKSRAQNLLIVANSCLQIFIIIIAVLITHSRTPQCVLVSLLKLTLLKTSYNPCGRTVVKNC